MRVVLDTNVIVSAALIRGGIEDRILRAWQRGAFDLVLSRSILEEMARAFTYERIRKRRWMTEQEVFLLIESLAEESIVVSGRTSVKVSRDPDDDKFLTAAIEGQAEYLVSGDKDLITIREYRNIKILSPSNFIKLISRPA